MGYLSAEEMKLISLQWILNYSEINNVLLPAVANQTIRTLLSFHRLDLSSLLVAMNKLLDNWPQTVINRNLVTWVVHLMEKQLLA